METLEQIKADAVEVFHFDRECRPQDRAHAYPVSYTHLTLPTTERV